MSASDTSKKSLETLIFLTMTGRTGLEPVPDAAMAEQVRNALAGANHRPNVTLQPKWYYTPTTTRH